MNNDHATMAGSRLSLQSSSYVLFIFILVFTPLAFGTVENWSWKVLEMTTAIAFLFFGASQFKTKKPGLKIPGLLPLLLLLGYMVFQQVPLPVNLVKFISPSTFELYQPLLGIADDINYIPLTVHRKATLLLLFNFTSYGLVYLLTVYHCNRPKRLKQTTVIVVVLGIIIGLEAILQKLTSPGLIYWFRTTPNSNPVGPWVYSNHFAGYMEMVFPLAIALFLYHRPMVKYSTTLKEKFISVMTTSGANRHLLLGTGAMLMAVSILLSISRGGIITLSLAFLFFVLFTARIMPDNRTLWAIILTIAVVLMISWLGWDPIIKKFSNIWGIEGIDTSGRLPVLLDSINLFRSFPFFGTGFGTFVDVYPFVRTVPGDAIFDHAHNDYMELLATGGIIGFVLAGWFLVSILASAVRSLITRRDRYAILMTSAAITGILAELFHSLADFQLYNGANGLYLFFLCGLAISSSHTRMHYRSRPTLLTETGWKNPVYLSIIALLLLSSSGWYAINAYRAEKLMPSSDKITLNKKFSNKELSALLKDSKQAAVLDQLEARYHSILGIFYDQLGNEIESRTEYLQAWRTQPASGKYLQQLALNLNDLNDEQTRTLLEKSVKREPGNIDIYFNYATWLLTQGQRLESFDVINQAIERIPWRITDIINFIYPFRFSEQEIRANLAAIPAAWHETGRKLQILDQTEEAIFYYKKTIEIAGQEELKPEYFSRLYQLYKHIKDEKKAIEVLKSAIEQFPDYAPFRIWMGDYYLKNDIIYRAKEEYTQALLLDPRNVHIKKILMKLDQE